ncbi:hypothetical protein F2Q70_00005047 [Brassica cretica]|uniref:Uncharacterized protein n=1 Tax=Brassica cretica TaxID=69181 RepID=A0A8S9IST8_BRACR|nr:hypothetical protein F2Q70_00005047 [Brassica cretica]
MKLNKFSYSIVQTSAVLAGTVHPDVKVPAVFAMKAFWVHDYIIVGKLEGFTVGVMGCELLKHLAGFLISAKTYIENGHSKG